MRYSEVWPDRRTRSRTRRAGRSRNVSDENQGAALYSVVLLNDDYTPMEFVVDVLETLFQKSPAEAYRIMMQVHVNGRGVAGVYPWEVAETKVDALLSRARAAGHPLQATIEDA